MRRITPALAVGASLVLVLLLESCRLTPENDAPKETDERTDVPADEPTDVPTDVSEPYETLKTAVEFSPSCTGFSNLTPPQMCAFREVLRYPEANDLFRRLVEEGTTAGQLYGLSGVYFTDTATALTSARSSGTRPGSNTSPPLSWAAAAETDRAVQEG